MLSLKIELIGYHSINRRWFRQPGWCAEIGGKDKKYGLKRSFLKPTLDFTRANSTGTRGVHAFFILRSGKLYEVCELTTWRRVERYFCIVGHDGSLMKVDKEYAMTLAKLSDGEHGGPHHVADEAGAVNPFSAALTNKRGIGIDVHTAAVDRIRWILANVPRVYLSFSGGKDSGVLMHLACEEARRQGRKIGVLIVDLEAQYRHTIEYIERMVSEYRDCIELYWVALPLALRNAVSQFQPKWQCWNPDDREIWVREPSQQSITDEGYFPFFKRDMEFEDFVPAFGEWYGQGQVTACLVGIRTDESLNRWRTLFGRKQTLEGKQWTTYVRSHVYNAYPIYDWGTRDVWRYNGKFKKDYNQIYSLMNQAGLTLSQQRLCQPYGDDQRKGLWLFHVLEPETWGKVVARVQGANSGALYAREHGNINGMRKISLPNGHTWQSYSKLLLASMPGPTREHFETKIAIFLSWWSTRGGDDGIPDFNPDGESNKQPSWRRICKVLLKNDYHCKGLSFSLNKSDGYHKYMKIKERTRRQFLAMMR